MNDAAGDCFSAAFNHLLEIGAHDLQGQHFLLVHGNLAHLPQDQAVNHAWVEERGIVHEVSNGQNQRLAKDTYYDRFKVSNVRKYTVIEAMRLGVEHKGPWDE